MCKLVFNSAFLLPYWLPTKYREPSLLDHCLYRGDLYCYADDLEGGGVD